jgi:hypothetical protein
MHFIPSVKAGEVSDVYCCLIYSEQKQKSNASGEDRSWLEGNIKEGR